MCKSLPPNIQCRQQVITRARLRVCPYMPVSSLRRGQNAHRSPQHLNPQSNPNLPEPHSRPPRNLLQLLLQFLYLCPHCHPLPLKWPVRSLQLRVLAELKDRLEDLGRSHLQSRNSLTPSLRSALQHSRQHLEDYFPHHHPPYFQPEVTRNVSPKITLIPPKQCYRANLQLKAREVIASCG